MYKPIAKGRLYLKLEFAAIELRASTIFSAPSIAVGLPNQEEADSQLLEDKDKRNEIFEMMAATLPLPGEKMKKDLDLYRSNLEKMDQVLKAIEDALQASRKQREKRAQEKKEKEAAAEQTLQSEEQGETNKEVEEKSGIELDK